MQERRWLTRSAELNDLEPFAWCGRLERVAFGSPDPVR
jgi:hypothetical protein